MTRPAGADAVAVLRAAIGGWIDDRAPSMGAALAFYTVFSIAPLLLIVISLAGLAVGEDVARLAILAQLTDLLGAPAAQAIDQALRASGRVHASITGTLVGAGVMLVGATSVLVELQSALDRIWRVPPDTRPGGWTLVRARLVSIGLLLGTGFLLIASLVVSAAIAAASRRWGAAFDAATAIAHVLDLIASFTLVAAMFAMIYRWIPHAPPTWRDAWAGAWLTSALFTLGKTLIGLYIGASGVTSPFGGAASVVTLLLWVYYSAQIFLFGAEVTRARVERRAAEAAEPDASSTR